jgi:nucleoside-diphosphate-sugar epimerase
MQSALIIGCGYTGRFLARRLLARGVAVRGTTRSGELGGGAEAGLELVTLDLALGHGGRTSLPRLPGVVVYYMVPTLARRYDGGARPHLGPLEAVLSGLEGHDLRGLVYLSSTSVYGDRGGGWVDERTAPAPASPWARMRLDLEERVLAFGRERGVRACVTRLPEIYGPGRGPVERLRAGWALRNGSRLSNRIHVLDLAAVLDELGERLDRELLVVSDDEPAVSREVYALAAELLGLAGSAVEAEDEGDADENRRALFHESKRCSNAELRSWLGRGLLYPTYREGLPTCL